MLAFKPNINLRQTHHAEGNSMASPTQTVVGKGTSNPLIAEGLLKILPIKLKNTPLIKNIQRLRRLRIEENVGF